METQTSKTNGSTVPVTIETNKEVTVGAGNNVVVIQPPGEEGLQTPEQLRAATDQLVAVLSLPVVAQFAEGLKTVLTARASSDATRATAELERAKVEADRVIKANDAYNQRAFNFATKFLVCLSITGGLALALVALLALTGTLKDASLSAFAMFVVGSIFGGTIYGTTLRKQETKP